MAHAEEKMLQKIVVSCFMSLHLAGETSVGGGVDNATLGNLSQGLIGVHRPIEWEIRVLPLVCLQGNTVSVLQLGADVLVSYLQRRQATYHIWIIHELWHHRRPQHDSVRQWITYAAIAQSVGLRY